MATLRNLTASTLSVPALNGRHVEPDEAVEVPDDVAAGFMGQDATWRVELDDDDPRTLAQLKAELEAKGLPTTGRKSELIERLATAPAAEPVEPASTTDQGE